MLKILDWYILKRYLLTFFMMLLLFVPIGITVDLAEKIGKMKINGAPLGEALVYYQDFTIYFANLLFPLFIFLSVIWFTSKLANNTEIIAILSSGVSFYRFLRPYIIGGIIISVLALLLGLFLAPDASKGFNEFSFKYLKKGRKSQQTTNIFRQINDNDYIFVSSYDPRAKRGKDFTLEHIEGNQLKYKIFANTITYKEEDTLYKLKNYKLRTFGENGKEVLVQKKAHDTLFQFDIETLTPVNYMAETLKYGELVDFIDQEKKRGSANIGRYLVVKYKKWSIPVSIFILTIIAISVSSFKRRGGMGVNLAFGVAIAMVFVFFDKIFGVLAAQTSFSPLLAVWIPNILFGILALYLLNKAKR